MASSSKDKTQTGITHNCGVFACIAAGPWPTDLEISQLICYGLVALQHRGQESAGIVTSFGHRREKLNIHRGVGLVSNVFDAQSMSRLQGNLGIGHTRYSTSACSDFINTQPFVVHTQYGSLAMAHNGQLVNDEALRRKVLRGGVGLSTESDSELITQALCLNPPGVEIDGEVDWPARIKNLMKLSPLSYSLVLMHGDRIYGVRDPYGNRPLCIGKLISLKKNIEGKSSEETNGRVDDSNADGWVISSESSGFLSIGARYMREVMPGEIVEITKNGIQSLGIVERPEGKLPALCIFEYVYFARPDTILEDQTVYSVRFECGKQLALEAPCDADIVSSVPESGNAAAHGFAAESGIQYAEVFCKNRYVGRSFIQPSTRMRQRSVAMKFGPIGSNVEGKRIVLIDDSIVRGNTIGPIITVLRDAGAKEVHIRIASPPVKYPCYMGINIPTRDELIANKYNSRELEKRFGANSLEYLSINGLVSAVTIKFGKKEPEKSGHCSACLTGIYPEKLEW